MRKLGISRAVLCGAAFIVSAAGAGWEVVFEGPAYTTLDGLNLNARPTGYCVGYENRYAGTGGPD